MAELEVMNSHCKKFMAMNRTSPVVAGEALPQGGGIYTLANGVVSKFNLEEVRSMPMPKWPWDFPEYENAREQGEFGEGATVRRAPEHG